MTKIFYIVVLVNLLLAGCGDYPGQTSNEGAKVVAKPDEGAKLTLKPNWGDLTGQEIPQGGDCHIDSINNKEGEGPEFHTVSRSGPPMRVSGWGAISVKEGVIASNIALALRSSSSQGVRLFAAPIRGKRQDVADYFKSPASIDTGFKSAIDLSDVTPGDYWLEVIQHKDGATFKCQYTARIIIEK